MRNLFNGWKCLELEWVVLRSSGEVFVIVLMRKVFYRGEEDVNDVGCFFFIIGKFYNY